MFLPASWQWSCQWTRIRGLLRWRLRISNEQKGVWRTLQGTWRVCAFGEKPCRKKGYCSSYEYPKTCDPGSLPCPCWAIQSQHVVLLGHPRKSTSLQSLCCVPSSIPACTVCCWAYIPDELSACQKACLILQLPLWLLALTIKKGIWNHPQATATGNSSSLSLTLCTFHLFLYFLSLLLSGLFATSVCSRGVCARSSLNLVLSPQF